MRAQYLTLFREPPPIPRICVYNLEGDTAGWMQARPVVSVYCIHSIMIEAREREIHDAGSPFPFSHISAYKGMEMLNPRLQGSNVKFYFYITLKKKSNFARAG